MYLELLDLLFKRLAELLLCLGMVLFSTEFVSQPRGVNHRLLRLLLGALGLVQKLIKVRLEAKTFKHHYGASTLGVRLPPQEQGIIKVSVRG